MKEGMACHSRNTSAQAEFMHAHAYIGQDVPHFLINLLSFVLSENVSFHLKLF